MKISIIQFISLIVLTGCVSTYDNGIELKIPFTYYYFDIDFDCGYMDICLDEENSNVSNIWIEHLEDITFNEDDIIIHNQETNQDITLYIGSYSKKHLQEVKDEFTSTSKIDDFYSGNSLQIYYNINTNEIIDISVVCFF